MILTHLVMFSFFNGAGGSPQASSEEGKNLVIGIGPMGKTRVHPHPLFCRVKQ
jgi:hypothetical protein